MKKFLFILILIFLSSCTSQQIENKNFESIIIQFDVNCDLDNYDKYETKIFLEADEFTLVGIKADPLRLPMIRKDECVQRAGKLENIENEIREDLDLDWDEKIQKSDLKRTLQNNDLLPKDELETFIEEENPERDWPGGIISAYQLYVTPNAPAVQSLATDLEGIQEVYSESLNWVWISEEDLNNEIEYWLFPQTFLEDTPTFPTNPTGEIASDCEEQANTLASLLIAEGYDSQNVRVVLGLVDFDGEIGGHAWVQVYEEGKWFDIEATAGSYYVDGIYIEETIDLPYDYFKYVTFPSIEIWAYYSNEYFRNEETKKGNAPNHWSKQSENWDLDF
jgi:hypothetical protein